MNTDNEKLLGEWAFYQTQLLYDQGKLNHLSHMVSNVDIKTRRKFLVKWIRDRIKKCYMFPHTKEDEIMMAILKAIIVKYCDLDINKIPEFNHLYNYCYADLSAYVSGNMDLTVIVNKISMYLIGMPWITNQDDDCSEFYRLIIKYVPDYD